MISDSFVSHEWGATSYISPGISFFLDLDDEDELDNLSKSLEERGKIHDLPANDYGFFETMMLECRICLG